MKGGFNGPVLNGVVVHGGRSTPNILKEPGSRPSPLKSVRSRARGLPAWLSAMPPTKSSPHLRHENSFEHSTAASVRTPGAGVSVYSPYRTFAAIKVWHFRAARVSGKPRNPGTPRKKAWTRMERIGGVSGNAVGACENCLQPEDRQ